MASWELDEALAEQTGLSGKVAKGLVNLIEKEECTLPFIARYKKQVTGDIPLDKLRQVFETLNRLKDVQKKMDTTLSKIEKLGSVPEDIKVSISKCRTADELELVAAPFKSGTNKKTLASRASELGLDVYAKSILNGESVDLASIRTQDSQGKELSLKLVIEGIEHCLADIIAKDGHISSTIKQRFEQSHVKLVTTKKKEVKGKDADGKNKDAKNVKNHKVIKNASSAHKYQQYLDFSIPVKYVKSHQVLAINRAESLKHITVKIVPPDNLKDIFIRLCQEHWRRVRSSHTQLFHEAVTDAYIRLVLPGLTRHCRASLKKEAEQSSVDTFGDNLRSLLLQPPCTSHVILGIDPGFTNGCKMAVISTTGEVLDTDVAYLHSHGNKSKELQKLVKLVVKFGCSVVAIGNGTACRDTEAVVSDCIETGMFNPVKPRYSIVNEDGSSIYSVSQLAEKELPDMDQNLRSAVSIARRLQDPLCELVKIEPHHVGVGMYQHDIPEGKLKTRLELILSECVSFIGVDINTASQHVLSHVSGLNANKAKAILAEKKRIGGSFICREQLRNVKGLGSKSYEQCAGFITVRPDALTEDGSTSVKTTPKGVRGAKRPKLIFNINPLDQTMVHPQSYDVANKLLDMIKIDVMDLGSAETIKQVAIWKSGRDMSSLADSLSTDAGTLTQILEALGKRLNYDIRDSMSKPLFLSGKTLLESLSVGDQLTGAVRNVTEFGAFVDIGVKQNGLIHTSKMAGKKLAVSNTVQVKIVNLDMERERIGLQLIQVL